MLLEKKNKIRWLLKRNKNPYTFPINKSQDTKQNKKKLPRDTKKKVKKTTTEVHKQQPLATHRSVYGANQRAGPIQSGPGTTRQAISSVQTVWTSVHSVRRLTRSHESRSPLVLFSHNTNKRCIRIFLVTNLFLVA